MRGYKLKPLLIFSGIYDSDKKLDREGVVNTSKIMKQAIFSKSGLNIKDNDGMIIEHQKYVPACEMISDYICRLNGDNDVALIYYCGHGFPMYSENTVYLAFADTTEENWQTCAFDSKLLIAKLVAKNIKRYIIIFDCCHSGFLCDMGENDEIDISKYKIGDGGVCIASTRAEDACRQLIINEKYFIPFSYYLAQVLLGETEICSGELSIKEIYLIIKNKLEGMEKYKTVCRIKNTDGFVDEKIFLINKEESELDARNIFQFQNHFEIEELKVLLVKTAIKYPIKYDDFGVPLGLWVIKGYLSTIGLKLKVDIYDERLEMRKCNNDKRKREKVRSQFEDIIKDYDVIGISVCTCEVVPALEKFRIAKKNGKVTLCGGIFVNSNEEFLIKTGVIDYAIPGVGTVPLGNLLARLLQDKKQSRLGEYIVNENGVFSEKYFSEFDMAWMPAQLPSMRKSMWLEIFEKYGGFLNNRMDVYTARGCENNCLFCSVQRESNQTVFRKKDLCVIEEINYLKQQGITYFSFKDEDFLSTPKRMMNILNAVKGYGIKFKIRARYDEMTSGDISLRELQELGVDEIQYGIESPDIHIRKKVNKGFAQKSSNDLVDFITKHDEYGIKANCSFIIGISSEDLQYYDDLFCFIKAIYNEKSKPKVYLNFLTPHPYNSQFPITGYKLATNDLTFFTHKFPVCYDSDGAFGVRKKMLRYYDKIVTYTNSELYNPLTKDMPEELIKTFKNAKKEYSSDLLKIIDN